MPPERLPDHDTRLAVARRLAGWELGDPSWADTIVAAYCNPEQATDRLNMEDA